MLNKITIDTAGEVREYNNIESYFIEPQSHIRMYDANGVIYVSLHALFYEIKVEKIEKS